MEVRAWQETIIIPTYGIGKPDKNPMFFENRVYQGSSGVVYPNPVIEKIYDDKVDQSYNALFLENDYLKIMVLPELGGRIQMAYDKIKQRHFIYYNQVIKPALVGLCGPWISGGIEFNWPQHHRPSTFEPVDFNIEENADGSKTIWVNEVERMFRTKGMAGFTLYPDKAYLEIKAKLYNRTSLPQTFLWWANPAVKVNDDYQSVFPPDVNAVFDHGKRDVSTFPIATGTYYKVDYSPGTDISRYKNIPVPTSYMAVNSDYDFVGGYEHDTQAGVLHVADHHVSPGKKQWTWGNSDFGIAWDKNLTDEDGPYIELMTGVFTDNQPDFSWLMPYEEKTFTQYFLPYRELGVVKNANKDVLLNMEKNGDKLDIKLFATSVQIGYRLKVYAKDKLLLNNMIELSPENVYSKSIKVDKNEDDFSLVLINAAGKDVISYDPSKNKKNEIPKAAKPAPKPQDAASTEELFLIGQHLEQYRHATYSPVPYYEEALKRDPKDARNNNALGLWYLRRGQFAKSESFFRKAIETISGKNPNPYDSEAYYNLGLCLQYQNRINEAYDAFFKATWSNAWQDTGYFSVAQIDLLRGDYELALEHINWSLDKNARSNKAWLVKVIALWRMDHTCEAIATAKQALARDQFNISVWFAVHYCYSSLGLKDEAAESLSQVIKLSRSTANNLIEYAIDFAAIGLYNAATELLLHAGHGYIDEPMVNYYLGYFSNQIGNNRAVYYLKKAASANSAYCFPNRLEDIAVLETAILLNPSDAKASYYLGNLWYDKRQYDDAITNWQLSADKDHKFPTVLRNLGIAYFNKRDDEQQAYQYFEKAYRLDPSDARVLMEFDQLNKRLNHSPQQRLALLEKHTEVTESRDDLYLERAAIYNFIGDHNKAFELMMNHQFHPWEGGEGKVSGQYIYSLVEQAKQHITAGEFTEAINKLEQAQHYPDNLGEGKLHGAQENDIFYWLGCAYKGLGDEQNAVNCWQKATQGLSEPSAAMFYNDQQPDKIFYQGLAWRVLGDEAKANLIFTNLINYGNQHLNDQIKLDYFAVSLPDLLIFKDDLSRRNTIHCQYILGLGYIGLQQFEQAERYFDEVSKADVMHFGVNAHNPKFAKGEVKSYAG